MSWYRVYRPQAISGLHLHSVREQLQQYLKKGKLPQVLLLAGPKGSGKTSTARILASIVNDPANAAAVSTLFDTKSQGKELKEPDFSNDLVSRIQRGQSYVVQEMDAASNRGIDEVRKLKEEVVLPPQEGKVKVYILDEVHMFTTEAFNALLKLLEEPPAHAMFILATTELHKIPDTISSRSTLIPFHKATAEEIATAIQTIIKQEKIEFDEEALQVIAERADGSFRDAVKLAEMLFTQYGNLKKESVEQIQQGYSTSALAQLLELVLQKDGSGIADYFTEARNLQLNSQEFFRRWLEYLHQELLLSLQSDKKAITSSAALLYILKALLALPARENGPVPFLQLEVTLLDMILRPAKQAGSGGGGVTIKKSTTVEIKTEATPQSTKASPILNANPQPILYSDNLKPLQRVPDVIADDLRNPGDSHKLFEEWKTFITLVEKEHTGAAVLLKSAKPLESTENGATVAVYYPFHKQCLDEPKTRQILQSCIENIAGGPVHVEFIVSAQGTPDSSLIMSSESDLAELAQDLLV